MILNIFSIYDQKAGAHLPPFFLAKEGQAIRTFSDCVNDIKHSFSAHPNDYTLFHHGEFECDAGKFILNEKSMRSLGNGIDFLEDRSFAKQIELLENIPPGSKPQAIPI